MKPTCNAGSLVLAMALVQLLAASPARSQDRGRGGEVPPDEPTYTGVVTAYEPDKSVSVGIRRRGGENTEFEYAIVKGKTQIELRAGVKAVEVGLVVSVWGDRDNPKNAARLAFELEAPTIHGTVTDYQADKFIIVRASLRGGGVQESEFSIVKGKTQIGLADGTTAIEVGVGISVWADKVDATKAAKILADPVVPKAPRRQDR